MTIKPLIGLSRYEISNEGRIFSKNYNRTGKRREMKLCANDGYLYVTLWDDKKRQKSMRVHRLVALNFIPNPDGKSEVNHIDGNKLNNHVSNLDWCTHAENMAHAKENYLTAKGSRQANSKLTEENVKVIKQQLIEGSLFADISKQYNVSDATIHHIGSGHTWRHVGIQND